MSAFRLMIAATALACVVAGCTTNNMPPGPPPPPPGQDCIDNTNTPCLCADGHSSVQTCVAGHYAACQCDGQPPPPPPPPGPTKKHGDVCVAPQFDCGSNTNIECIVDHPTDAQGICRRVCGSFSDCLNDSDALHRFDTDCCDIGNGTRACGMKSMFPAGACN